jgi:hypothetical protein
MATGAFKGGKPMSKSEHEDVYQCAEQTLREAGAGGNRG